MKELIEDVFVRSMIQLRWYDKPEVGAWMAGANIGMHEDPSFHEHGKTAYLTSEQFSKFVSWAEKEYNVELEIA